MVKTKAQWLPLGAEQRIVVWTVLERISVICMYVFALSPKNFLEKYGKFGSLNKAGCSLYYFLYLSLCENN